MEQVLFQSVHPSLLDAIQPPVELPVDVRKLPLEERFPIWVEHNGNLIEHITRLALSASRTGARRLSAKALFEQVRASALVENGGPTPWRLDNSYTAPLARLLMERHAELRGLFETRQRRAK
jgi:hypothetical protein